VLLQCVRRLKPWQSRHRHRHHHDEVFFSPVLLSVRTRYTISFSLYPRCNYVTCGILSVHEYFKVYIYNVIILSLYILDHSGRVLGYSMKTALKGTRKRGRLRRNEFETDRIRFLQYSKYCQKAYTICLSGFSRF